MPHRAQSLQAIYNRRREMENVRLQHSEPHSNFWDKVKSRFSHWTTQKHYQIADADLQKIKETKGKEKTINERRMRLCALFATEKSLYDAEIRQNEKSKSRRIPADNETLTKIQQRLRDEENLKKRLNLEAKLYGKWRHGVDDDNILFESKTDNDQTQREIDLVAEQERNLRMQEEIACTKDLQKERQEIREKEITEIRTLQENHIDKLKERQKERDLLKDENKKLRNGVDDVDKDLESSAIVLEPAPSNARNLKSILSRRNDFPASFYKPSKKLRRNVTFAPLPNSSSEVTNPRGGVDEAAL